MPRRRLGASRTDNAALDLPHLGRGPGRRRGVRQAVQRPVARREERLPKPRAGASGLDGGAAAGGCVTNNVVSKEPGALRRLTQRSLLDATRELAASDPDLAVVVDRYGPPPLWAREPGFHTLIHIILEQQVSLASAQAAYDRLVAASGRLVPERFLALNDTELKTIGFSRQKAAYGRGLAQAILDGRLDLARLGTLDDAQAKVQLTEIKGIGSWTADIYLLMVLRRPDTWPSGDLALASAVQRLKRMRTAPTPMKLERIGRAWQPWRAVAARILWHYYLSSPRQQAP